MTRARTSASALLALVATMLAACGDDDDDDAGPSETSAAPTTAAGGTDDTGAGSSTGTSGGGVTSTTADPGEDPDACNEDRVGGSLTMSSFFFTTGLDPSVNTASGVTGATELGAIYDTLMRWDPETGEFLPQMALGLEPNDDFTVWTLRLRPDVTFGNGDPVDADAVIASIRRLGPQSYFQGYVASLVQDMVALDPLTVEFTLGRPWAGFAYFLAMEGGMIVNAAVAEERGDDFVFNAEGAGAGPYEVVRFAPSEELVLEPRADYWGGVVCLEELRFVSILGSQATYDAFTNGESDVAFLREGVPIAQAVEAGYSNYRSVVGLSGGLFMNNREGRDTADPRVRRAVAAALDLDIINERANGGAGLMSSAVIHEESVLAPSVPGPAHDPDLAARLVAEAKADGWDGTLNLLCNNQPQQIETAIAVEAMLEAAGMEIDAETLPTLDVTRRVLVDLDFDVTCQASSFDASSATVKLPRALESTSQFNAMGYANPEMDAALTELRTVSDLADVQAAMDGVQEIWTETVPGAMYQSLVEMIIWTDEVHGLVFTRDTAMLYHDAWIEG